VRRSTQAVADLELDRPDEFVLHGLADFEVTHADPAVYALLYPDRRIGDVGAFIDDVLGGESS
jgi:hypothetical protein